MFFSRILAAGFLWVLGTLPVQAQDCAVPNQGSPYQSLAQLKEGQILHLPTGVLVTADQLIDTVAGSRVVYIGETHDNLEAHRVQLEIIRKLLQRHPGKVAVGMEMFRQSAQPQLQAWREGRLSRQEFNKLFRKNWGSGFRLYAPIIDFIQAQNIPLLALKSTKAMESRLRQGGPGQPGLPEIDFDDPYHRAYAMALFGANEDHAPEAIRPYQMLLLWEEAMAEAVAGFLNDPRRQDWTLVVLAGGFHVQYGHGIPKRAFRRHPHGYSIILPAVTEIPGHLEDRKMEMKPVSIPLYIADFAWKLQYKAPQENHILLGVHLEERPDGLRVAAVVKESNAARMAIQTGDILLRMDGEKIEDIEELQDRLRDKTAGDAVTLLVRRAGREISVKGSLHPHQHDRP